MLRAIARETEGNALIERAKMDASILPVTRLEARPDMLTGMVVDFSKGVAFKSHASAGTIEQIQRTKFTARRTVNEMGAALNILKDTDFLDKMDEILKNTKWENK